jgi:hypothetical protein
VYKVVYVLMGLYVLTVVLSGCAATEIPEQIAEPPAASVSFATSVDPLAPPAFAESESAQSAIAPINKILSLDLGLQVINLKTSFFEKKETLDQLSGILENGSSRHYFNVLATSQSPTGGLQTEGEFSYSMADVSKAQCNCDEEPRMLRLSAKDRWEGFSFGADYRSLGKGFIFVTGEKVAESRDEAQVWGERSLGLFSLRGSLGESWEQLADINQTRLTKTASARLNFNRSAWTGGLTSSFSLAGQGADATNDATIFTQTLTNTYRPVSSLSLASNFSIKRERNISTGIRTDTPGAGFTILYSPWRDRLSLTNTTSYTKSFSPGGLSNVSTVGLTTGVNWKLGKFFATNDVLSFNLNYNRQLDFLSPSASREDLTGLLQLKVMGF